MDYISLFVDLRVHNGTSRPSEKYWFSTLLVRQWPAHMGQALTSSILRGKHNAR